MYTPINNRQSFFGSVNQQSSIVNEMGGGADIS
jgi:hypothetical protein